MNDRDIDNIIDEALNAACLVIQDRLGVKTGDVAGMVFSGTKQEQFEAIFREYIRIELMYKELTTEE